MELSNLSEQLLENKSGTREDSRATPGGIPTPKPQRLMMRNVAFYVRTTCCLQTNWNSWLSQHALSGSSEILAEIVARRLLNKG
jgi:hypothetical protein